MIQAIYNNSLISHCYHDTGDATQRSIQKYNSKHVTVFTIIIIYMDIQQLSR